MVSVKQYIFYDWHVNASIIPFCPQSWCFHKRLLSCWQDVVEQRSFVFSQHYQIDAVSQFFYLLLWYHEYKTQQRTESYSTVFPERACRQDEVREMSALTWLWFYLLCRTCAATARDSIHKLAFSLSSLPLIKLFIIHHSIHNAKHVQNNWLHNWLFNEAIKG